MILGFSVPSVKGILLFFQKRKREGKHDDERIIGDSFCSSVSFIEFVIWDLSVVLTTRSVTAENFVSVYTAYSCRYIVFICRISVRAGAAGGVLGVVLDAARWCMPWCGIIANI